MKHRPPTTYEAVETFLAARQADPRFAGPDQVAAAAALRLAAVLDGTDNGSAAANLSRELRQQLEALRLTEVDPLPSGEELRQQRDAARVQAEWNATLAELGITPEPVRPDDDDPPPPVLAF